jgi:hypothetical protein
MNVRPHVARNTTRRRSAIDKRTTCYPGYAVSQRLRKQIERHSAGSRPSRSYARPSSGPKVDWAFTFAAVAYNLVRTPKLIAALP